VGPTWQRRERGNAVDGLRKLKEEAPFGKYAKAAQAEWAEWTEREHDGLRAKRPRLGRMGQNRRKNYFRIKLEFSNIQRLWIFGQGDLGGILT
jgi:hypothetical protein